MSLAILLEFDSCKSKMFLIPQKLTVIFRYYGTTEDKKRFGVASLLKGLSKSFDCVRQFPPSHYTIIDMNQETYEPVLHQYFTIRDIIQPDFVKGEELYLYELRHALEGAMEKRMMAHREIGCLVSGGVDSSLIAALVNRSFKRRFPDKRMKTFSIGMAHGTDLAKARAVAEHLGTDHREYVVTEEELFRHIPEVVYHLECFDTTTIRASTPNWLLCKYIYRDTDVRVVFNGDGADELFGSYLYFANAPSKEAFHEETVERIERIHESDGLRSDHSISHGLEARTPFLDKNFVRVVMAIPTCYKLHSIDRMEKSLLRKAFADSGLLPDEVLWRRKEAFSDGVSNAERDTQTIIREILEKTPEWQLDPKDPQFTYHLPPPNNETKCYRAIFEKHFPGHARVVKDYWMPKWCEGITDPSARELKHYHTAK